MINRGLRTSRIRIKSVGITILMTVTFLLSACSKAESVEVPTELDQIDVSKIKEGVDSSDFECIHHEVKEFEDLDSKIREAVDNNESADVVLDMFDDLLKLQDEFLASYSLSAIRYSENPTDNESEEEKDYHEKNCSKIMDIVGFEAGNIIYNLEYVDMAKKRWGEDIYMYYANYHRHYYEDFDELSEEHRKLVNDYMKINGKITDKAEYIDYSDDIADIYKGLIDVRQKISKKDGYVKYTNYMYENAYYRDYPPTKASKLCEYIKKYIVPVYAKYQKKHSDKMDAKINKQFSDISIEDSMKIIYNSIDEISPEIQQVFYYMMNYHLYYTGDNENRSDSTYTTIIGGYNEPVIFFGKRSYTVEDFDTVIHEFGHYYEFYNSEKSIFDKEAVDVAEIYSQGLECLYAHIAPDAIGENNGKYYAQCIIERLLWVIIDCAIIDEFEQKAYSLNSPSKEELCQLYVDIANEYGYDYEMNGRDEYEWMRIHHLFDDPLYSIGYATSAIAALELWDYGNTDFKGAVDKYQSLVENQDRDKLVALMKNNDLGNPFEESIIESLSINLDNYIEN